MQSKFAAETAARNSQEHGGLRLIAVGVAKHVCQEDGFHVLDAIGVERVGPVAKLVLNEFMESNVAAFAMENPQRFAARMRMSSAAAAGVRRRKLAELLSPQLRRKELRHAGRARWRATSHV